MFNYTLALLKNKIHIHPKRKQREIDFVIEILEEGQGYLTRKTDDNPYVRVVFFEKSLKMTTERADALKEKEKNYYEWK